MRSQQNTSLPSQVHRRRLRLGVDELGQRPPLRRPLGVGGHLGAEVGHSLDVAGDRAAGDALVAVPPASVGQFTLEQSLAGQQCSMDELFP